MKFDFKGNTYELKPLDLSLRNKTIYFVSELNKLITKYTFSIDMKPVKKYEKEISELLFQLNQSKDYLRGLNEADEKDEAQIKQYDEIVKKQTERYDDKKNEYENNDYCNLANRIYSESVMFAIEEYITNEQLIKSFLKELTGIEIKDFDLNDTESKRFAIEIISFFLQSRN